MTTDSLWEPHCLTLNTRTISLYPGNVYTAAEWAVTPYAEKPRKQFVGTGIRVLRVPPGQRDTPLWKGDTRGRDSAGVRGRAVPS